MPRGTVVMITLALALVPAAPGLAQDDGVTYDPDSPAGREYALPLERERQKHSSGRKGGDGKPVTPQLFGEGVERADATGAVPGGGAGGPGGGSGTSASGSGGSGSGSGPGGSGAGAGSSPSGNGGTASPAPASQTQVPPVERVVPAGAGGSGGSAGLLTGGVIAAAALMIGALVRRRPGAVS